MHRLLSRTALLKALTVLFGIYFVGVALACLIAPQVMADQFGVTAIGVHGASTISGDLGGLFLAMGIMSLSGFRRSWRGSRFLWAVALLLAAIALGRSTALLFEGFDLLTAMLAAIEVILALIFIFAARHAADLEEP